MRSVTLRCVRQTRNYSIPRRFFFRFRIDLSHARDLLTDKHYMERNTLLATLWNATDAHTDDRELAERTRQRLESGELTPTGNCRNVERAYWARDEEE